MNTQPFTILGETLWWDCPGCQRKIHKTRQGTVLDGVLTGADFRCSQGCSLRHCVAWESEDSDTNEAKIYSYDPCTCDMKQLPLLAQLTARL